MPSCGSSIQNQTSATTTLEIMYGQQDQVPRIKVDLATRCISSAIPSAKMVCSTMLITTYSNVTSSELASTGSWSMCL